MSYLSLNISVHTRFLHLPVCDGKPKVGLQIVCNGQVAREFSVELADGEPVMWWAFYDIRMFNGQTIHIQSLEELSESQAAWLVGSICQSDQIQGAADLYHEPYRPQFHFTSRRGWNNDPNGLTYADGQWHMFYQHNPFGTHWGNMHWGHAVSSDLLHWTELPTALYQKSLQDMAFSGGGLVDSKNTAGWKTGVEDPLVVAFTSTGRGECLAYSLDHGDTWVEYPGNPFLTHRGRDPKIIWYTPGNHWVLMVYEERFGETTGPDGPGDASNYGYAIYTSPDLKSWQLQSFLPGWYECPEFFEAAVEGQPGTTRWVVYGFAKDRFKSAYQVGSFDGRTFIPEMDPAPSHAGPNFYAGQIFSQAPDQRNIMIAWLAGAQFPDSAFSQGMSLPLELSLRPGPDEKIPYRLCFNPIRAISSLHTAEIHHDHLDMTQANQVLSNPGLGELLDMEWEIAASGPVSLWIGDYPLVWNPEKAEISFAGKTVALPAGLERLNCRVLIDRGITEVFAERGWAAFAAMTLFPQAGERPLKWTGDVDWVSLHIYPMKSIWDHQA